MAKKVVRCLPSPDKLVFTFWVFYICASFGENPPKNASMRVHARRRTHGVTDTRTEANWFYNLFHAICYRYETDNNLRAYKCSYLYTY